MWNLEKEGNEQNYSINNIVKHNISEGRENKDMYWKLLKNGGRR
jgi:hypothetical protein